MARLGFGAIPKLAVGPFGHMMARVCQRGSVRGPTGAMVCRLRVAMAGCRPSITQGAEGRRRWPNRRFFPLVATFYTTRRSRGNFERVRAAPPGLPTAGRSTDGPDGPRTGKVPVSDNSADHPRKRYYTSDPCKTIRPTIEVLLINSRTWLACRTRFGALAAVRTTAARDPCTHIARQIKYTMSTYPTLNPQARLSHARRSHVCRHRGAQALRGARGQRVPRAH